MKSLALGLFSAALGVLAIIFFYIYETFYQTFFFTSIITSIITIVLFLFDLDDGEPEGFIGVLGIAISNYLLITQRVSGLGTGFSGIGSFIGGFFRLLWNILVFLFEAVVWILLLIPRGFIFLFQNLTFDQFLVSTVVILIIGFVLLVIFRD